MNPYNDEKHNIRANTIYFQFIVGKKKEKNEAAVHGHASGVAVSYTYPLHKAVFCPFHAFFS